MAKRDKRKVGSSSDVKGARVKPSPGATEGSTDHLSPQFCLRPLGKSHPLSACNAEEKVALIDRLFELSQLTWRQIKAAPRHGQGFETIARSSLQNVTFPADVTEDVDILSFRFAGRKPMLGFRTGRLLTLIALDRDFTAYDHG